jgi:hypothetical protein
MSKFCKDQKKEKERYKKDRNPPTPKDPEPLERNPAKNKAKLLLQMFGPDNACRELVDQLFMELFERFGDQDVPSKEALVYIREFYRNHKELSQSVKELLQSFKPANPIHFEDQAELYPLTRQRSEGPKVMDLADLVVYASFCSYDVLQQTPEALDVPRDQQHVVTSFVPTASNVMPDARWSTVTDLATIQARDDVFVQVDHGVTQVYKMVEEEIHLVLERTSRVTVDSQGTVTGCDGLYQREGLARAKTNSRDFRRIGTFDKKVIPAKGDRLTPKVNGEALFISTKTAGAIAVDRIGNKWSFESAKDVRFLVECVPSTTQPERVFLTHAWRCGTVNNVGIMYSKELLKRKKITITMNGITMPLEFPSFHATVAIPRDGYVLHKGRQQYFLKETDTIELWTPATKAKLEQLYGDVLVTYWQEGKTEYAINWEGDHLHLRPVRVRPDKHDENDFFNMQEVINGPPFQSFLVMFEELELEHM